MPRLSQKALRLYDRKGLLVPEAKDPFTEYRYYTVSQLEKGMKIDPLLLPGKVSGISKNRCPIYSGITVRNQQ